jgi:hypothetical protein
MGGPGFFGLRFNREWLVVSVWGAATWIHCDDRIVEDTFYEKYGRRVPWITNTRDELSPRVVGSDIHALRVSRDSMSIQLSSGAELVIEETPERRPILEGSKESRAFAPDDDLRQGVFLSPTAEIWV